MLTRDFDYDLPADLIAQQPLPERSLSRLLHVDARSELHDRGIRDLPELLQPNDLLVLNDTRVMAARLWGEKETGGKIELLVERLESPDTALVHIRASKPPRPGGRLSFAGVRASTLGREGDLFRVRLLEEDWSSLMARIGHMPLPPYICRPDDADDLERYQTVYARVPGAVAAPTAGLHFDQGLLRAIRDKGVSIEAVTLHVGAGTFQPVRSERVSDHVMHYEQFAVSESLVQTVTESRKRGGRVVAVGTTVVRALESAAAVSGRLQPMEGQTNLFITPGYAFQVVDCLLTNFHLPQSTLLMLVAAFAGYQPIMTAYQHAIAARYRFFSYGDAMFIERPEHAL